MNLVVDASVALKWFFRADEPDVAAALELLRSIAAGRHRLLVPAHFVAEMAAVLARETPRSASSWLGALLEIRAERVDGAAVMQRAVDLSRRLGHHLFDTLYHAVALEAADALLVTADERYLRKAQPVGRIARLATFSPA